MDRAAFHREWYGSQAKVLERDAYLPVSFSFPLRRYFGVSLVIDK